MLVSEFDFDLPPELIAQRPPEVRGSSRTLFLDRGRDEVRDHWFRELPTLLSPGDLLVLNDTRVLPARLFATRAGLRTQAGSPPPAGVVEVLLTEQVEASPTENVWRALVKPAKKVPAGEQLLFAAAPGDDPLLRAEVIGEGEFGERTLQFEPLRNFHAVLEKIGHLPLPPYIHRDKEAPNTEQDRDRYQTVYSQPFASARRAPAQEQAPRAQNDGKPGETANSHESSDHPAGATKGSAAAPTAGLHFTPEILQQLEARGVEIARVTLHVGLGTFQPVRVDRTEEIKLHAEPYTLSAAAANSLNRAWADRRRIVAVGTTTTRTLEHVARQFEAEHGPLSDQNPLRLTAHSGSTGLFLSPGPEGDDKFKLVGGLLTNFHLPQSTLLMLVSAFAGRERALAAYRHAVAAKYKFFSYGDCMLIL